MRSLLLILLLGIFFQDVRGSVIDDLAHEVETLMDGEDLVLEYTFEGCFGPYHHGIISIEAKSGELHYLTENFDDKNKPGISQAGKYQKSELLKLLADAKEKESSSVFGNAISYRLSTKGQEILKGADRIEQRHFIELFQPFTSLFPKDKQGIIPKISSGGFVH